jgi:hypothetical protein
MAEIDLMKFTGGDVIVLSGRPMGEELAKKLKLSELEEGNDVITVKIPFNIVSLNSSFFLGLFAASVRKLGEVAFKAKYHFEARPPVLRDIEDGISQALNTANPLVSRKPNC